MHIRKSAEPKEWTEYKNIPGVQFSGIPALQESLYREQGYLCAYCERRIPVRDKMSTEDHRIEHWHCRDKYPEILKRNREQTLRGVIEGIISKRGKHILWTQKDVKDQLEKWSNKHDDGNGHAVYYPFNGIVVYFLKKKLAMLSKKGV